jgi:dGTPase
VRLTHSLEVAQIGRTMARALGLNEDLTEALCLAHDIGHPPFGHAGEDALEAAMAGAGGFDHNAHTLRLLTRLECPYPGFDGLNLSWEALEGLAKHNGPVTGPLPWALAEANAAFDLALGSWPGLEAQVAAIADDIAYDNHDIDDGLRAGLFSLEQLLAEVPLAAEGWAAVMARYPGIADARLVPELVRELIGRMVNDVLAETVRRAGAAGSSDEVRAAGAQLAGFSPDMAAQERALKRFLYAHMYDAPEVKAVRTDAQAILAGLFAAYREDPALLPEDWRPASDDPVQVSRRIGDFIAGMTDRYAVRRYEALFGPSRLHDI